MKKNTNDCVVEIEDLGLSSRLNALPVAKNIPWEEQLACPACGIELETCARLVNHDRSQILRYGLCAKCGYMGYIDRPSQKWIIDFYSHDWDKEFIRTPDQMKKDAEELVNRKGKLSRFFAASLYEKFDADKEGLVCDIGSGYGLVLKYFERAGFKNVIGVENSLHRSKLVKDVFGFEVLHGGFEEESVQSALRAKGPIGLFFSHHVFEHTYHPDDIMKKISSLQREGDHLIFALPNAEGEHINYALLYLVHLHSFTKESLEVLFNRHGYEIVADNSPDQTNIIVAAKKTAQPQARYKTNQDYKKKFTERFQKGFRLPDIADDKPYALYWEQLTEEADTAKIEKHFSISSATRFWWRVRKGVDFLKSRYLKRVTAGHRLLLRKPDETPSTDVSACEIRFKKEIFFFIK